MAEIDLGAVVGSSGAAVASAKFVERKVGYNLIPFPYELETTTISGVNYTVYENGTVLLQNTASENADGYLVRNKKIFTKQMNCHFSCGVYTSDYYAYIYDETSRTPYVDKGSGINLTVYDSHYYSIIIRVNSGKIANRVLFKPMLVEVYEDGTYPTEYQSYSLSNKDLTNKVGIAELNTTAKTLSGAINEHEQNIVDLDTKVGAAALNTTAQDLSSAINEVNGKFKKHYVGTAKDSTTNDQGCITLAVNVTSYFPNGIVVECVYVEDYVAIPFLWNNNMWYAKILSPWADTKSINSTKIGEATFTYYVL